MFTPKIQSPSRRVFLWLVLVLPLAGGDGFAASSIKAPAPPATESTRIAVTDRFEFHSDPWVNLHHFLYQWSRADEGIGTGRREVPVPERPSLSELSGADHQAWTRALAFYRSSVASRGHFDPVMLQLKEELLQLAGDPAAAPPDRIEGIGEALAVAMPVYLGKWWPRHNQANRAWAAPVVELLKRHESRYVAMTVRVYGSRWPDGPRRVDVSAYANFRAGYTAEGHTVIYSTDPGNQGWYALETLLHEVQHTREVGGAGREELFQAFQAAGLETPRNLWHALIFATAGEFVRSVAADEGLPEHTPYWIREGFQNLRGWRAVIPPVLASWPAVVRGETSRVDAFRQLTQAFAN